jgi:hypothetical protein
VTDEGYAYHPILMTPVPAFTRVKGNRRFPLTFTYMDVAQPLMAFWGQRLRSSSTRLTQMVKL